MMTIDQLKAFCSPALREMPQAEKYMLKEYVQLLILDWLSTSPYSTKICFIGGTCLRLVKGIDRCPTSGALQVLRGKSVTVSCNWVTTLFYHKYALFL